MVLSDIPVIPEKSVIKNLQFNKTVGATRFSCSTDWGFICYDLERKREVFHRMLKGELAVTTLLNNSNLLVLVGGGVNPAFAPNVFVVWDDNNKNNLVKTAVANPIINCLLTKEYLVVVTETALYIYGFLPTLIFLKKIHTIHNPNGLASMAIYKDPEGGGNDRKILVCPGLSPGFVRIIDIEIDGGFNETLLHAHQTNISKLTLHSSGKWLATTSEIGTIVRVYQIIKIDSTSVESNTTNTTNTSNTSDETSESSESSSYEREPSFYSYRVEMFKEFRRGTKSSAIWDLAFNHGATLLALVSNRTVPKIHIFDLAGDNSFSKFYMLGVRSEWSKLEMQVELPVLKKDDLRSSKGPIMDQYRICFALPDVLIVIGPNGYLWRYQIDREHNQVKEIYKTQFL